VLMTMANRSTVNAHFTRLYAKIRQEDGVFTVSVRLQNHLKPDEAAWGEEVANSIEIASSMIGLLAAEFSITEEFISIDIRMDDFRHGTLH
jgi:pantothenate synthetase